MHRRALILAGLGFVVVPSARGADRPPTPSQVEGPFYPLELPRPHDTDLVRLNAGDAAALGQVTHVFGAALKPNGEPIPGALVEIWQCDANGRYHHPGDRLPQPRDPRFQGYGRTLTDRGGAFRFRTIRPVSYATDDGRMRAPHIHLTLSTAGARRLTTQLYVEGEPLNDTDFVLLAAPALQRPGLIRPYTDGGRIEAGAWEVHYDIVVMA